MAASWPLCDLVAVDAPDGPESLPALPAAVMARARGYANASRAASNRAKYEAAWDSFAARCAAHGHEALPAHTGTVAVFSPTWPRAAWRRPGST